MKLIALVSLVLSAAIAVGAFPHETLAGSKTTYTTKYDNINLDEILQSERLLKNYVNCLLDKGPCTPDGSELKANLPDAVNNDCKKCSEKQKDGSARVTHHLIDNKPEWWDELEKKYNPDGSYRKNYLKTKDNTDKQNENKEKSNEEENEKTE